MERDILKNRGLLREGVDVKFGFVAKHRGALPVYLMCEALGVSWGGFYAWLTRPRGRRSLSSGAGPVLAAHYGLVYAGKHDLAARGGRADDGRVASGKPVALLHHSDQGSQYTKGALPEAAG